MTRGNFCLRALPLACCAALFPVGCSQNTSQEVENGPLQRTAHRPVSEPAKAAVSSHPTVLTPTTPEPTGPASTEPAPTAERPRLVLNKSVHHFGLMSPREVRSHTFRFHNRGDAPLDIKGTATNCKCVSHKLSHTTLNPGEEGTLRLTWRGGEEDRDRLTARVRIETNDPDHEVCEFSAIGRVGGHISLTPDRLQAESVSPGGAVTLSTVISSQVWDSFEISDLRLPHESLSATTQPLTPDEASAAGVRSGWRLSLTAGAPLTIEDFDDHLEVTAGAKAAGESKPVSRTLRLPVGWRLRQLISLSGPGVDEQGDIHLGPIAGAATAKRFLLKVSDQDPKLEVKSQDVTPSYLSVSLQPYRVTSKSALYRLEVSAPQGVRSAPGDSGQIRFEFDHPRIKEFSVGLELGASI